jgi:hypothetical protein
MLPRRESQWRSCWTTFTGRTASSSLPPQNLGSAADQGTRAGRHGWPPDAVPAWRSSPSLRIQPRSARLLAQPWESSPASSVTVGDNLPWGGALRRRGSERTDRSTTHPLERDSPGGRMSTSARSRFMRVQKGAPRSVMTPSTAADHPQAWIRNREQGDCIVTRGRMSHHPPRDGRKHFIPIRGAGRGPAAPHGWYPGSRFS